MPRRAKLGRRKGEMRRISSKKKLLHAVTLLANDDILDTQDVDVAIDKINEIW